MFYCNLSVFSKMTNLLKSNIFQQTGVAIILLLLLVSSFVSSERRISPELQIKIEEFIKNAYLPTSQVEELGLSITQDDGELLYTEGFGMANREKGILNGNSTQFIIGSITKSFTALATVKVLHDTYPDISESVLDTPIRKLFPANFTLIDRFRSEQVTFRDLLAHRVCISDEALPVLSLGVDTTEELVYRLRYRGEVCGFRGDFNYNNDVYTLAGEIVGAIAQKPFQNVVSELLVEIGMFNTTFVQSSDDFSKLPGRAQGYYVRNNQTHLLNEDLTKRIALSSACCGLFSTPNDMAKYLQFQLNLGTVDGRQVVPKSVMEWLRKPSNFAPNARFNSLPGDLSITEFGYGLGLVLGSYNGWEHIQHAGNLAPYISQISLFPSKKLGIFSTTNTGPLMVDQMVLHSFIFETLMGNKDAENIALELKKQMDLEEKAKQKLKTEKYLKYKAKFKSQSQSNISGSYGNGALGELQISEEFNKKLNQTMYYFKYGVWYQGWLHQRDNFFEIEWETDVLQYAYAFQGGFEPFPGYLIVFNGTVALSDYFGLEGIFMEGVNLGTLPVIPWDPNSCFKKL